jgi:2-polyprenyl-6-methoxyphenol hydroxylase-like FAD-dependent oxidoreductase
MAAELARHGQRCRIIDRLEHPSGYCKAIGVTPRTLEVWEDMGVAGTMVDAGLWISGMRMIVPGQAPRDVVHDLSDLPYGNLGIPQYETERILGDHLKRYGIMVERGVTLTDLHDDGHRVTVDLKHANGCSESAEYRYVVGCDGAHSAVRHALGIGFPGDSLAMDFMLGDVEIDWDVPRGLSVFTIVPREDAAPDFLVVIPLPERKRYRVSMLAPDELATAASTVEEHGISSERPGPSLDRLQEVADRLLPGKPQLSDLRWSSLFRISMRLADRYRVGNCFIAGDAAHIHPPTGGQGMNTGIQDAYNLAWKMASVLRATANARLLDSYSAERRPVGADVVARTRAATLSFGRQRGEADRLENTQIRVNYRSSEIVDDTATPDSAPVRAGDRAPDAHGLRRAHVGFPLRLFDVLRGTQHVLITYLAGPRASNNLATVEAIAAALKPTHGEMLRVVAIAETAAVLQEPIGLALLRDGEEAFGRAYGAAPGTTFLVRPDGYVALVCAAPDEGTVQSFLQRVYSV